MLAVLSEIKCFKKSHKLQFGEYERKPLVWHVLGVNKKEKSVLIIADSYCGKFTSSYNNDVVNKLLIAMDEFAMRVFTNKELEFVCIKENHYACLLDWDVICMFMTNKKFVPDKETGKGVGWWHMYDATKLGYVKSDGSGHNYESCITRHMRPALWVKYDGLPANNNENTDKNKKKK